MLRRRFLNATARPAQFFGKTHTRRYATELPKPPSTLTSQSRIERLNRRLPKFLHRYTSALANAPVTHISSFLILHELTAILPLFGLAGFFHYTHWLPPWFAEGAWAADGVERFGRYFKRKGWIRGDEAAEAEREVRDKQADTRWKVWMKEKGWLRSDDHGGLRTVDKTWRVGEGGVRLVVEFATAYALTKALLVPRIAFSVWATPWFARMTVVPFLRRFRKRFGRGSQKSIATPGAGTGAGTGAASGGVVPKSVEKPR